MGSIDDAIQTMVRNLEEKTGKSLAQWVKTARSSKLTKHRELLNFLKAEQGLTHGYANFVALRALAGDEQPGDRDLISAQYAGAKTPLRDLFDVLITSVNKFGGDVEVSPKKAYV